MIRKATIQDLEPCVKLGIDFFGKFLTDNGVPVIEEDVRTVAIDSINRNQILVVDHDGEVCGLTAWMIVGHPANHNYKIFFETIWCVKSKFKTDTLLLLRALEREALSCKADMIVIANLSIQTEKQLRRIYTNKGFNFLETHYSKSLRGIDQCHS